jgi:hypothetical protein
LLDKDINQALQRLHVLLGQKVVVHGDGHEVDEAAVQLEVAVDVPERVVPVAVVEVSIAAEHLLDDALDVLVEILWEPGRLANPLGRGASESIHGLVEVGGRSADRSLGRSGSGRDLAVTRSEGGRLDVFGRIRGEDIRVVDLANDPSLYADNV